MTGRSTQVRWSHGERVLRDPALEKSRAEQRTEQRTERERRVLEKGVSNPGFHDLGSAKIPGGVGKGIAAAMAGLRSLARDR